ncbi:hypothetical protein [Alterisphingorhabdus coralli]|uniref:Uncharacterized protein n=1 Tax=Alterisphingorhabdus coralli TaxID=3071408 RepID=A0AA97I0H4_9SPHN|nr:hypothetical protein [Parasphingorhabdus sp. SCSIO 66989]WOE74205.1 hypothetical protein RB602_10095 [Parasphingorhabdus sp. SCSIO 66989]
MLGVDGPKVCEEWVKSRIEAPGTYSWSSSNWQSGGPDVSLQFTSRIDGNEVQQIAECNFVDPESDNLVVDDSQSSIDRLDF